MSMDSTKKQQNRTGQVVLVRVEQSNLDEKELFYLFTASQVEEVLPELTVRSVPFSPDFVKGMCCWRGLVIPVVDLNRCFGFIDTVNTHTAEKYIVVRTVAYTKAGVPELKRCVLQVSDTIGIRDVTGKSISVTSKEIGLESSRIMGAYQQNANFYMVPDLLSILDNKDN